MAVLDVVIGLVFTYLILSLACTATNETIAQWLNSRAKTLQTGIRRLIVGDVSRGTEGSSIAVKDAEAAVKAKAASLIQPYNDALAEFATAQSRAAMAAGEMAAAVRNARRAADALQVALVRGDATAISVAQGVVIKATAASEATTKERDDAKNGLEKATGDLTSLEEKLRNDAPSEFDALLKAHEAQRDAQGADLVDRFYKHPIIAGLSQSRVGLKGTFHLPSYIPAPAFSTALTDIIRSTEDSGTPTLAELRETVATLPTQLRTPLLLFIDQAEGDIDRFRQKLEAWYSDAMERVSGLYKRKTQAVILALAFGVTLCTDADSIRIGRVLASNSALRDAVVARAQAFATAPPEIVAALVRPDRADTTKAASDSIRPKADSVLVNARDKETKKQIVELQSIGIPLGWNVTATERARIDSTKWIASPSKWQVWLGVYEPLFIEGLPGLLITTMALSLGAPFWFDVLNKIINIRAAGRAPEERPKAPEALPPPRGS